MQINGQKILFLKRNSRNNKITIFSSITDIISGFHFQNKNH